MRSQVLKSKLSGLALVSLALFGIVVFLFRNENSSVVEGAGK